MDELDLNKLPGDIDYCDGGPLHCTQVPHGKMPISIQGLAESQICYLLLSNMSTMWYFRVAKAIAIGRLDGTSEAS